MLPPGSLFQLQPDELQAIRLSLRVAAWSVAGSAVCLLGAWLTRSPWWVRPAAAVAAR